MRKDKQNGTQENVEDKADLVTERSRSLATTLLLKILAEREKEGLHGYGISREIELRSHGEVRFGDATIYPALRLLESQGLVTCTWDTGGPGVPRKVFMITEKGKEELVERSGVLQKFTRAMLAFFEVPENA